jgi:hypothetical protein
MVVAEADADASVRFLSSIQSPDADLSVLRTDDRPDPPPLPLECQLLRGSSFAFDPLSRLERTSLDRWREAFKVFFYIFLPDFVLLQGSVMSQLFSPVSVLLLFVHSIVLLFFAPLSYTSLSLALSCCAHFQGRNTGCLRSLR